MSASVRGWRPRCDSEAPRLKRMTEIACFRRCMSIGGLASTRLAAAFAVLIAIPIGALASARLHLASVLGVVVVMLLVSARRTAAGATRAIL